MKCAAAPPRAGSFARRLSRLLRDHRL